MEPKYPAPEAPEVWQNLTVFEQEPKLYVRVNIDKNTKGYTSESTVSVEGTISHEEMAERVSRLLRETDEVIRAEISRRKNVDETYREGPVGRLEVSDGRA
jgi:hypothetical protein